MTNHLKSPNSKTEKFNDYKSEKPDYTDGGRLPTIAEMSGLVNFGGRVVFDKDGEQRIVSAAELERTRLRDAVAEAAIEEYKMEHAANHGGNTITRTDALIKMQRAMKAKRAAVDALLEFETTQKSNDSRP